MRLEWRRAKIDHRAAISKAWAACRDRIRERNLARAGGWAKGGRADFLAELGGVCTDAVAVALAGHVIALVDALRGGFHKVIEADEKENHLFSVPVEKWTQRKTFWHCSGVKIKTMAGCNTYIHARDVTLRGNGAAESICLASGDFIQNQPHAKEGPQSQWMNSILIGNRGSDFFCTSNTVAIFDGDVEFVSENDTNWSLIVANGSITSRADVRARHSYIAATGVINLPYGGSFTGCTFSSPEEAHLWPERLKPTLAVNMPKAVKRTDDMPFGIRFFSPAEVGIEATRDDETVTVKMVPAKSAAAATTSWKGT